MRRPPLAVTRAPDERLRAIRRPVRLVVELARVPQGFVGELGHTDGMRGRTGSRDGEAGGLGCIVHVRLMVRGVEGLAVPAGGEVVDRHDASWTGGRGECLGLGEAGVLRLQTGVAQAGCCPRGTVGGRAADDHAEALQ